MFLAPFVCGVLRDWYRAGLLRWVLMQVLLFATAVVGLSLGKSMWVYVTHASLVKSWAAY